jgi:uncharacterized membrane protein
MSTSREHLADIVDAQAPPDAGASAPAVSDTTSEQRDAPPPAFPTNECHSGIVVVRVPASATAPQAPGVARPIEPTKGTAVHIAPNIRELVTAAPIATPQDVQAAKERRDLNVVVHGVLIIGLAISTALMLIGVGLALAYQRDLPTSVPDIGEVVSRALALRPSGFLALGLLVLIATPILRVIGSIGAFLYARDWRFASLTALVLVILLVSLVLGRG